jgi:cell division protein FtsW (lipid II flippase)
VLTVGWKQLPPVRWWRRQREIRMLRSWYVRVGPEDMSARRRRLLTLALAGGPVAAVVAVPVMLLAAVGSDASVVLLAAVAAAGLVVVAGAIWRSAGSLTLCVALLGSVAAVLSVHGAGRPTFHWTTVAALIAASVVTLSACLVRACREPDAVSWVAQEPAEQHVPGTADGP